MKHLPTELLYLLKVYNYIKDEIGIDRARSHADMIRRFIAEADYLKSFPGIMEYLSEEKSMEDIITYIQRNEKTYSLLGQWKDREIEALFAEKGIEGFFGMIGGFSVERCEDGSAYFVLPLKECMIQKIVLENADITDSISIEKVLWLELYRSRDGLFLEMFDNDCNTTKIGFSDFHREIVFLSAAPLSQNARSPLDGAVRMAQHIYDKFCCNASLLNEKERKLLPLIRFLSELSSGTLSGGDHPDALALFSEYGIEKGQRLLSRLEDDKSSAKASKKLLRLLRSKKCLPLTTHLCEEIISSQSIEKY